MRVRNNLGSEAVEALRLLESESGIRTGGEDWSEFKARQLRDAKEVLRFDFEQTSLPLL